MVPGEFGLAFFLLVPYSIKAVIKNKKTGSTLKLRTYKHHQGTYPGFPSRLPGLG